MFTDSISQLISVLLNLLLGGRGKGRERERGRGKGSYVDGEGEGERGRNGMKHILLFIYNSINNKLYI